MTAATPGTAVVTGASSGIGEAFARHLAGRGHDLFLVARRHEHLSLLAGELKRRHSVKAEVFPADLADEADIERVEKRLAEISPVDILVNNAGFGTSGAFVESDAPSHQAMINVHVAASVRFAAAVLPGMISRRAGAIINVSSMAAFLPRAERVMYGATKLFLVAFSRALSEEVAGDGVRILALCPGFTRTQFHSGLDEGTRSMLSRLPGIFWMSPEAVVERAIRALGGRKVLCVPGILNRIILSAIRSGIGASFAMRALRLLGSQDERSAR